MSYFVKSVIIDYIISFIRICNSILTHLYILLFQGHSVVAYDINTESMEALEDAGAVIASSPAEVAGKADSIISMLPNSQHVRNCYTGEKGVFE